MVLENAHVRIELLPDLGGKIQSMVEKVTGKEALFAEPVVRPARILPRMAFISGGVEVSFPISHTPSQIETVHLETLEDAGTGRCYVYCGETELRFGMQVSWSAQF